MASVLWRCVWLGMRDLGKRERARSMEGVSCQIPIAWRLKLAMKSRVWKKRAPCYGVLASFGPHATGRWHASAHVSRDAGKFRPSCYGALACFALRAIVGAAAGRARGDDRSVGAYVVTVGEVLYFRSSHEL